MTNFKFLVTSLLISISAGAEPYCTYKNIPLYGRVKIVTAAADIRIKEVHINEDLRVEEVEFGATYCGQWEFVESGEDFTVEFTQQGEELRIRFVDYLPGT